MPLDYSDVTARHPGPVNCPVCWSYVRFYQGSYGPCAQTTYQMICPQCSLLIRQPHGSLEEFGQMIGELH